MLTQLLDEVLNVTTVCCYMGWQNFPSRQCVVFPTLGENCRWNFNMHHCMSDVVIIQNIPVEQHKEHIYVS